MKSDMTMKVDTLISLISKSGQILVRDGQLFVSPPALAKQYGDQIRSLKPEIMIALGYCPICAGDLIIMIEDLQGKTKRHSYCKRPRHFDSWRPL
jgi:hypothetical protein